MNKKNGYRWMSSHVEAMPKRWDDRHDTASLRLHISWMGGLGFGGSSRDQKPRFDVLAALAPRSDNGEHEIMKILGQASESLLRPEMGRMHR